MLRLAQFVLAEILTLLLDGQFPPLPANELLLLLLLLFFLPKHSFFRHQLPFPSIQLLPTDKTIGGLRELVPQLFDDVIFGLYFAGEGRIALCCSSGDALLNLQLNAAHLLVVLELDLP